MMLGIQATIPSMHSMVLAMNLAGAMILLRWVSMNSCLQLSLQQLQGYHNESPVKYKISFSRLCKVFFSLSKCNQSTFQETQELGFWTLLEILRRQLEGAPLRLRPGKSFCVGPTTTTTAIQATEVTSECSGS